MKSKAYWRQVKDGWQYMVPLAVIGGIEASEKRPGKWWWNARIMCDCRNEIAGPPLTGYANSLEGAKRIVEILCEETGTIESTS